MSMSVSREHINAVLRLVVLLFIYFFDASVATLHLYNSTPGPAAPLHPCTSTLLPLSSPHLPRRDETRPQLGLNETHTEHRLCMELEARVRDA